MCEDVGDRKGMKKEGQRRRTQEKRRKTEKKMGRKREGRARKRGKAEEGKSVRRKKALRPGGRDCFMKHHGGRGQTNGGGTEARGALGPARKIDRRRTGRAEECKQQLRLICNVRF